MNSSEAQAGRGPHRAQTIAHRNDAHPIFAPMPCSNSMCAYPVSKTLTRYALRRLKVEVQSDCDHVTVVIELFVDDVLIFGLDFLQPDIPIGAVN